MQADYTSDDLATLEAICAAAAPLLASRLARREIAGLEDAIPGTECEACGTLFDYMASACPCGGFLVGSMLPRRVAGRYVLRRRIGRGGMGVVYEALDESLGRTVAIKTLPEVGAEETAQLREEARMMASLQHPGLAYVHGLEMVGPLPVLVVEYLPGGTLADRLLSGPLPAREVIRIGIEIAEALEYLHGAGVLHRDLKPSNVAFAADGRIKLLDFGLAIAVEKASSAPRAGTLSYLSPGVLAGNPPTTMCDLWSLGVLLCEALRIHTRQDLPPRATEPRGVDRCAWTIRCILTQSCCRDDFECG